MRLPIPLIALDAIRGGCLVVLFVFWPGSTLMLLVALLALATVAVLGLRGVIPRDRRSRRVPARGSDLLLTLGNVALVVVLLS